MTKLKQLFFIGILLGFTTITGYSQDLLSDQNCDFKVLIIKDRYLFGKAFLQEKKVRKTKVSFSSTLVRVWVPYGDKSMLLAIKNTNCRAYCPRAKRVRQLHSHDKRLLIKLLKKRRESLLKQLKACNF
jgi:hypothetical protein